MKRRFFVVLFAVGVFACLALGLTACGGGNSPSGGAHSHNMVHYSATEATCAENGTIEYWHCSRCGKNFLDDEGIVETMDIIVAATGHDFTGDWESDATHHWHECMNGCGECVDYAEHDWNDESICSVCAYDGMGTSEDPWTGEQGELSYRLSSDSMYYTVVGRGTLTSPDVAIPSEYNGVPVKEIESRAFRNDADMISLTIPESITAIGAQAFFGCTNLASIEYNAVACDDIADEDDIFYDAGANGEGIAVIVGAEVTHIPERLFYAYDIVLYSYEYHSANLRSVTFEAGSVCESIGDYAFSECAALEEISLPDGISDIGMRSFAGCKSLTAIALPDNLTYIGIWAFVGCSSLAELDIPDSVTEIAAWTFSGCDKIIETENGVQYVDDWVVGCDGNITDFLLRDDTRGISSATFINQTELVSVKIPDSVLYIGRQAFDGCTALTEVVIGNGTKVLGSSAFRRCVSLTDLTIGANVEEIGVSAFDGCMALTIVNIPDSIVYIGDTAFEDCISLEEVSIGKGLAMIGVRVFDNCSALSRIYYNAEDCRESDNHYGMSHGVFVGAGQNGDGLEVTIGKDVLIVPSYFLYTDATDDTPLNVATITFEEGSSCENIGSYAFYGCAGVQTISLPQSIVSIGEYAFCYCRAEIIWAENAVIEEFGEFSFYGYEGTGINIPASVSAIAWSAFADCDSLEGVYISDLSAWCGIDFGDGVYFRNEQANPLYYAGTLYLNDERVTTLVIPQDVTAVNSYAFYNCNSLESVVIHEGVTFIGSMAFGECDALASVTLENTLNWYNVSEWFDNGGWSGSSLNSDVLSSPTEVADRLTGRKEGYNRYGWIISY